MTSSGLHLAVRTPVQIAEYPPAATFGPRQLRDHELVWLLRGSARRRHRRPGPDGRLGPEQVEVLRPGTLALSQRGSRESYSWDAERTSRHAYVHFDITAGLESSVADWPATRSLTQAPVLQGLCDYLTELAGQPPEVSRPLTDRILSLLVELFLADPLSPGAESWPPGVDGLIDHVLEVWTSRGMCILDVDDLAEAAQMSTGHLHRVFRTEFGCGPARALELVRLARAAISLQRSNASLEAIAAATGFANPYHFSRRFRLTYGCPPGAFRQVAEPPDPMAVVRGNGLSGLAYRLL